MADATQLQMRRGTTAQTAAFTGAVGEVTVDTDKDTLVVHDGATAGGHPLAKATISGYGTYALRPSAASVGNAFYYVTTGIHSGNEYFSDGSVWTLTNGGRLLQEILYNETADKFINSGTYADLVSQSITLKEDSGLLVDWRGVFRSNGGSDPVRFKLVVDGDDIIEFGGTYSDLNNGGIAQINHLAAGLGSGARIVKIQWKYLAGSGISINCSSTPDAYYSRMILQEISG